MSRIHYERARKRIEKNEGKKLTPSDLLHYHCKCAQYEGNKAFREGVSPQTSLGFNFHYMLSSFSEYGRQCFELGPKLAQMFKDVDLSNVKAKHIRMPYKTFWLTIPEGTLSLWAGKRTGFHDIWGFYVSRQENGTLMCIAYGAPNKYSLGEDDDTTSWIVIDLNMMEDHDLNFQEYLTNVLKNEPQYAPWHWDDRGRIESTNINAKNQNAFAKLSNVTSGSPHIKDSYVKPGMPGPSPEALRQHMDDSLRTVVRLAINAILYLTSPKREVSVDQLHEKDFNAVNAICKGDQKIKPSKRRKLATKITKRKITQLTRLAPELEKQLAERKGGWVIAHWQMYWTGKGRQNPTPLFKLPFKTGDGGDDGEVRKYEVENEEG